MGEVKLIIVAGMSGTGKSSTAQNLARLYNACGSDCTWYHEEMKDRPIRWADGGEFTVGESNSDDGMKCNIEDTIAEET